MEGLGFRVSDLVVCGFGVEGLELRGSGLRDSSVEFGCLGSRGLGLRVEGVGFRV